MEWRWWGLGKFEGRPLTWQDADEHTPHRRGISRGAAKIAKIRKGATMKRHTQSVTVVVVILVALFLATDCLAQAADCLNNLEPKRGQTESDRAFIS